MQEELMSKAVLLGVDMGEYDMSRSMRELSALCEADNIEAVAEIVQRRDAPDAALYMGEGRVAEARLYCQNLSASLVVFDAELTGSQIRNLSNALDVRVIDRTMLILDIFASRAVTAEGKLQTELAELRYRLPRLAGLGVSMSRQGGGGGGGGGARRGAGESRLEYDKRYVRERIDALADKLLSVSAQRSETRKARAKSGVVVIALTGYTNVGKSSLLNKLCDADVYEQDKLFATLDPTVRKLTLPSGLSAVAVDTVGFVSRLPHGLVNAFRSTLEEASYADVILKVCDVSDEEAPIQLEITDSVLKELHCDDIPQLTVYNKCDKLNAVSFDSDCILTSAKTGMGLDKLLIEIDKAVSARTRSIKILLPYDKLAIASIIRTSGTVLQEDFRDDGVYYEAIIKATDIHYVEKYLL